MTVHPYIIQNISSNNNLLRSYLDGKIPSIDEVRTALCCQEKICTPRKPDHYFTKWMKQQDCWQNQDGGYQAHGGFYYADFLWKVYRALTKDVLESRGAKIYLKAEAFVQWQDLVTKNSPMVLQCAYLSHRSPKPPLDNSGVLDYAQNYLKPNFIHSSLPSPYIPQLEHLLETQGLCEKM